MNYTKGPWKFTELGDNRFISDAEGRTVCNLLPQARPLVRERANARLIAAAPELYEFIRDLVAEPERMSDDDLREKTLFEAQELINKAKGA